MIRHRKQAPRQPPVTIRPNARIFAVQSKAPITSTPAPGGRLGQISKPNVDMKAPFNYATWHEPGGAWKPYWEWMNQGYSVGGPGASFVRHSGTLPLGKNDYPNVVYGVIIINPSIGNPFLPASKYDPASQARWDVYHDLLREFPPPIFSFLDSHRPVLALDPSMMRPQFGGMTEYEERGGGSMRPSRNRRRGILAAVVGLALTAGLGAMAVRSEQHPDPRQRGGQLRFVTRAIFAVSSLAMSGDGRRLLAGNSNGTMALWDLLTGEEIRRFDVNRALFNDVASVGLSADGRLALSASTDGMLRFWDVASGKHLGQVEERDFSGPAALSPDGRFALSGCGENIDDGERYSIRVWGVAACREVRRFPQERCVTAITFSADGKLALSGDMPTGDKPGPGIARLWEVETGRERQRFVGHLNDVWCVALSADGRLALTGGGDHTARLWDVATGKELRQFLHEAPRRVRGVALSADGRRALTAADDSTIKAWDTATGKKMNDWLAESGVKCVAMSADGRLAALGGLDEIIRVFDLPEIVD